MGPAKASPTAHSSTLLSALSACAAAPVPRPPQPMKPMRNLSLFGAALRIEGKTISAAATPAAVVAAVDLRNSRRVEDGSVLMWVRRCW